MLLQKRQEKSSPGNYEIVSLTLAKAYLYVTGSDQDTVLTALINSAVSYLEQSLDFVVDTSSVVYQYYDAFDGSSLPIWHRYISSTDFALHYWSGSSWVEFSNTNYRLDKASTPPRVILNDDTSWPEPDAVLNAVRVSFKVNTSASFYSDLKAAVLTLVAARYENREMTEMPPIVRSFVDKHRMPGA